MSVEPYVEWCVAWGGEDANDCAGLLVYDDEADARDMAQWIVGAFIARRTVTRSPWERTGSPWRRKVKSGERSEGAARG